MEGRVDGCAIGGFEGSIASPDGTADQRRVIACLASWWPVGQGIRDREGGQTPPKAQRGTNSGSQDRACMVPVRTLLMGCSWLLGSALVI